MEEEDGDGYKNGSMECDFSLYRCLHAGSLHRRGYRLNGDKGRRKKGGGVHDRGDRGAKGPNAHSGDGDGGVNDWKYYDEDGCKIGGSAHGVRQALSVPEGQQRTGGPSGSNVGIGDFTCRGGVHCCRRGYGASTGPDVPRG
mmetsp:Transcript_33231/g.98773  ORF Transcript_33231/g.98773 Transcript_33231/m.98773 type:complete len:142 (-) Transcript_33231:346-771(-)